MSQIIYAGHDGIDMSGAFKFHHFRGGRYLGEVPFLNIVPQEWRTRAGSILYVPAGAAKVANFYVGLFKGDYTPVDTDTGANIATNATEATEYSQGTRPAWTAVTTDDLSINTASMAEFSINGAVTIYGAFVITNNVKGGATGYLVSAGRIPGNGRTYADGDTILVEYGIRMRLPT